MADIRHFASTSNLIRFTIKDKTSGQGKTGLSTATTGLVISTICDNEASATAYTQAGGTIQTITTLGTFAAPSASNCRFKEVDSTNHKGLYEFQFADARFAVSNAKRLVISVNDAEATILDADYEIELTQFDPFDATNLGLSKLTSLTFTVANQVDSNTLSIAATPKAQIVTAIWQDATAGDFTVASSIGKSLYTSGNAPGAANGISLVGSNMGSVSSVTGNVGGSVASVTGNVGGSVGSVTATVSANVIQWNSTNVNGAIPPDSTFIRTGTAQAGGASTITLDSGASATNNFYQNQIVTIISGTGAGQSALILTYAGSTKVATINGTWATNPTSSSVFVLSAFGAISANVSGSVTVGGYSAGQDPATLVWQDATAGHFTVSGSIGKSVAPSTLGTIPGAAGGLPIVGSQMDLVNAPNSTAILAFYRQALAEAYPALRSVATLEQFINLVTSELENVINSGTTRHMKKLDGSTDWGQGTYDSSTVPTQVLRTT